MANLRMAPNGGYAPLRVQRTFQTQDNGRGGRAAALAESLGVILDAAPGIAALEGRKAFEAGVKARIDGVKAENAGAANKSLLGFMFSNQAEDGFHFQDAQMDIPVIQSEELLGMESRLRESRNPGDLRAYFAERDAYLQEQLAERPDVYRYTVAEALQKTRVEQAKLFTSWVQSNREKDRRAAAAAAAKVKAEMRAAELRMASNEAFALAEGGTEGWVEDYVKSAMETYGLKEHEAKAIAYGEIKNLADIQNSPELLQDIDPKFLPPELREDYANTIDTLFNEQQKMLAYEAAAAEAEQNAELERLKTGAIAFENQAGLDLALGKVSLPELTALTYQNEFYNLFPTERDKFLTRINKVNNATVDMAQETAVVSTFESDLIRGVSTNDMEAVDEAYWHALENTKSDTARARLAEMYESKERVLRDALFEPKQVDPYLRDIRQIFDATQRAGTGNGPIIDMFTGGPLDNYFEANVDTEVTSMFEGAVLSLAQNWYESNPDQNMGFLDRRQLYETAFEYAIQQGQRKFGKPQGDGESANGRPENDPVSSLDAIVNTE